jgi:hypothetical protein
VSPRLADSLFGGGDVRRTRGAGALGVMGRGRRRELERVAELACEAVLEHVAGNNPGPARDALEGLGRRLDREFPGLGAVVHRELRGNG